MKVKKVSSSYYVVADMDKAAAFYGDLLGLSLKFRDGNQWSQYDVGGAALALADRSQAQVGPGEGATVVLEVEDLAATRQELLAKGLAVTEVVNMGNHGAYFTLRDPDGNVVQLFGR